MSAAPKNVAQDLHVDGEEETDIAPCESGLVAMADGASARCDELPDDEDVMTVTLDEIELLDPPSPRSVRRRSEHRRLATRAGERRSRSTRPIARRDPSIEAASPATESLARGMGALLLVAAIFVMFNAAAQ